MFFGITAMVLVGISWISYGIVMGKAPKQRLDVSCLLFVMTFSAALISFAIGMIQGIPNVSGRTGAVIVLSLAACGVFNYFQLDVMSRAMQNGPNGIVWSVCQSGFVFPFLMGIVFFHEPLNGLQKSGFVSIILSLILFGLCKDNKNVSGKWKLLTAIAFLMTGCNQVFQNLPSYFAEAKDFSAVWRTCIYSLGMATGAVMEILKTRKMHFPELKEQLTNKTLWLYVFLLEGIELLVSYFLLYPGLDRLAELQLGAIAFPIMVSACLIFFDLFSLLILREKHKLMQWIALFFCIAGVILLSAKNV